MAIAIEGFTIVVLKERIEESYDGGLPALASLVSNGTALADDDLWRCSFMASADAGSFLKQANQGGLNGSQGPDPDLVVVCEHDLSVVPNCEWLQVAQWEKGVIAWREGTSPDKVIAREGWSPEHGSRLSYLNEAENLEFLRVEDGVHVYFDKRQGREVYVGRTQPDPDAIFKSAARVIDEYGRFDGQPGTQKVEESKLREAISQLDSLAKEYPDSWPAFFFIGKGRQATGETELAYQAFHRAFELEQQTESIPRELAGICLSLGKKEEAVQVAQKAACLSPDHPQTLGNLACAYLIAGQIAQAAATIKAALKLNASDSINQQLETIINEVATGQRDQPRRLSDLLKPPRPKLVPVEVRPRLPTVWDLFKFWK